MEKANYVGKGVSEGLKTQNNEGFEAVAGRTTRR